MAGHLDKNFSLMNLMKRNPEVAPVIIVVGVGCGMSAYYIGRLLNNPHTVINHKGGAMPWATESLAKNTHVSLLRDGEELCRPGDQDYPHPHIFSVFVRSFRAVV
jgi:hypothetical protein